VFCGVDRFVCFASVVLLNVVGFDVFTFMVLICGSIACVRLFVVFG